MKEKTKKIILIGMIVLSVVGVTFAFYYAKDSVISMEMKEQVGPPPDSLKEPNDEMEFGSNLERKNEIPFDRKESMSEKDIVTLGLILCSSILFSFSILYYFMSRKEHDFYKNSDKRLIYILSNVILIYILTISIHYFVEENRNIRVEANDPKDEITLNKENVITEHQIDLNTQEKDITIVDGGTYTLQGKLNHSILIDSKEEVKLILNNVEIESQEKAAIIGLSAKKLTIFLEENSENILSDGGNSEFDGCIFSNAELEFDGTGTLIVNGNQKEGEGIATEAKNITFQNGNYQITSKDDGINAGGDGATITINGGVFYINASGDGIDSNKNAVINGGSIFVMGSDVGGDAGIDTDDGFTINGGLVIALGSDMVETPLATSKQKSMSFTLDSPISKNTPVCVFQEKEEILCFSASKSFKTIIISSEDLENKDYSLYVGGSHSGILQNGIYVGGNYTKGNKIIIQDIDTFSLNQTINEFAKKKR